MVRPVLAKKRAERQGPGASPGDKSLKNRDVSRLAIAVDANVAAAYVAPARVLPRQSAGGDTYGRALSAVKFTGGLRWSPGSPAPDRPPKKQRGLHAGESHAARPARGPATRRHGRHGGRRRDPSTGPRGRPPGR